MDVINEVELQSFLAFARERLRVETVSFRENDSIQSFPLRREEFFLYAAHGKNASGQRRFPGHAQVLRSRASGEK